MSFDDLFGGAGWKEAIKANPKREDAIIRFYTQQMKQAGNFDFGTSTRIKNLRTVVPDHRTVAPNRRTFALDPRTVAPSLLRSV